MCRGGQSPYGTNATAEFLQVPRNWGLQKLLCILRLANLRKRGAGASTDCRSCGESWRDSPSAMTNNRSVTHSRQCRGLDAIFCRYYLGDEKTLNAPIKKSAVKRLPTAATSSSVSIDATTRRQARSRASSDRVTTTTVTTNGQDSRPLAQKSRFLIDLWSCRL